MLKYSATLPPYVTTICETALNHQKQLWMRVTGTKAVPLSYGSVTLYSNSAIQLRPALLGPQQVACVQGMIIGFVDRQQFLLLVDHDCACSPATVPWSGRHDTLFISKTPRVAGLEAGKVTLV